MNKVKNKNSQPSKNPLIRILEVEFFSKEDIQKWLPFVVYCTILAFIYISNRIYAEKRIRHLNALQKEVRNAQADYYTIKSNIENLTKPTEIARRVKHLGLKQNLKPAEIIKKEN
ncbi:hypothetical protein GC194_08090 [bacterium]|nr:hypothetical protein [bacterium]